MTSIYTIRNRANEKQYIGSSFNIEGGVYQIVNIVNGKTYVGSAVNFERRLKQHLIDLKANVHVNIHLQQAFNKYGESSFDFEILRTVSKEKRSKQEYKVVLLKFEQFYIDSFDVYRSGYNRTPKAGSRLGAKLTDEQLVSFREKRSKHKRPVAWNKGLKRTQEQKDYQSNLMQGRKAWNRGVVRTEEQKQEQRRKVVTSKRILALDKQTGEIINTYDSLGDLCRTFDVSRSMASSRCKSSMNRSYSFSKTEKDPIPYKIIYEQDYLKVKIKENV